MLDDNSKEENLDPLLKPPICLFKPPLRQTLFSWDSGLAVNKIKLKCEYHI